MLVVAQVSSMKTRRSMLMLPWVSRHVWRAAATSSRSCSAACRSFFARQVERVQCRPHGGDTNFDAAIAFHPLHQLGEGHVGMGGHVAGKNVKMVIEFAPGPADFRQGCLDPVKTPPRQRLVNV